MNPESPLNEVNVVLFESFEDSSPSRGTIGMRPRKCKEEDCVAGIMPTPASRAPLVLTELLFGKVRKDVAPFWNSSIRP